MAISELDLQDHDAVRDSFGIAADVEHHLRMPSREALPVRLPRL